MGPLVVAVEGLAALDAEVAELSTVVVVQVAGAEPVADVEVEFLP